MENVLIILIILALLGAAFTGIGILIARTQRDLAAEAKDRKDTAGGAVFWGTVGDGGGCGGDGGGGGGGC